MQTHKAITLPITKQESTWCLDEKYLYIVSLIKIEYLLKTAEDWSQPYN